jgi:hypothetical protein
MILKCKFISSRKIYELTSKLSGDLKSLISASLCLISWTRAIPNEVRRNENPQILFGDMDSFLRLYSGDTGDLVIL